MSGGVVNLGYYADLARRLSPGTVAAVAARRAYRTAQHVLYRYLPGVDEAQVLAAHQVESAAELPGALARRPSTGWADHRRRPQLLQALQRVPGAADRALTRAERAASRTFDLFGTQVAFSSRSGINWSLDPVSGYQYPMTPSGALALLHPGRDPKYPWALGRLDCLVALGQGYWVGSEPAVRARFARQFVDQLSDFIRSNPVGLGIQWSCPMEIALRAANIAQALLMFGDAPEANAPEFLLRALTSLATHTAFVEAHLEDAGAVPNNHLLANYVGLLVVGLLFPQLPSAGRQVALAAHGLREQMRSQVHPDGVSFEGSVPYHRLGVELFALAYLTAEMNGVSLGEAYARRLRGMFAAAGAYCSQSGLAPQFGDNDSGRVFPLRDRPSLDHGYLAPLGAALFRDPALKPLGSEPSDEMAWLLGADRVERFQTLPGKRPASFSSAAAGFHVLRLHDAVLSVSAGAHGQRGVGGHNHNDQLSFELHCGGAPVIVDPGSPTYGRDPKARNAYRSTAMHNTLSVDGREQSEIDPGRLFALPDQARGELLEFVGEGTALRLKARHHGFAGEGGPGVAVQRTFSLEGELRTLLVEDRLEGSGVHAAVGHLHLPDNEVRLRVVTADESARAGRVRGAPRPLGALAAELGPQNAPHAVILFQSGLAIDLERYEYSAGYGQVRPATRIVVRLEAELPAGARWVVLF